MQQLKVKLDHTSDAANAKAREAANANQRLRALGELCSYRTFSAGAFVFEQGDNADSFYIVLKGAVEVVRDSTLLSLMFAVSAFGEQSLLSRAEGAWPLCPSGPLCTSVTSHAVAVAISPAISTPTAPPPMITQLLAFSMAALHAL